MSTFRSEEISRREIFRFVSPKRTSAMTRLSGFLGSRYWRWGKDASLRRSSKVPEN